MKYVLGIVITLIILCIAAYFTLNLWGIENPVSRENFQRGLITVGILAIVSVVVVVMLPFFFKNHAKGYDRNGGNVAKPKINQ